jgi:hypothetical protein
MCYWFFFLLLQMFTLFGGKGAHGCWKMKLNTFGMYVNFSLITICFIYLKWYVYILF